MRLTIFVGESDQWHRHPVQTEIVQRAHAADLAGASAMRDIEGYGASSHIYTTRIFTLSGDLPAADRIQAFLPKLDELISEGVIILDSVKVIKYAGRAPKDAA